MRVMGEPNASIPMPQPVSCRTDGLPVGGALSSQAALRRAEAHALPLPKTEYRATRFHGADRTRGS